MLSNRLVTARDLLEQFLADPSDEDSLTVLDDALKRLKRCTRSKVDRERRVAENLVRTYSRAVCGKARIGITFQHSEDQRLGHWGKALDLFKPFDHLLCEDFHELREEIREASIDEVFFGILGGIFNNGRG